MSDFTLKFPIGLKLVVVTSIKCFTRGTHPKFFESITRNGEKRLASGSSGLSETPNAQIQPLYQGHTSPRPCVPIAMRRARSVMFSAMNSSS